MTKYITSQDNLYYDEVIVDDDEFVCNVSVCTQSKKYWFGRMSKNIRLQNNVVELKVQ